MEDYGIFVFHARGGNHMGRSFSRGLKSLSNSIRRAVGLHSRGSTPCHLSTLKVVIEADVKEHSKTSVYRSKRSVYCFDTVYEAAVWFANGIEDDQPVMLVYMEGIRVAEYVSGVFWNHDPYLSVTDGEFKTEYDRIALAYKLCK